MLVLPPEFAAKECYRVSAYVGDMWYLESYSYAYDQPQSAESE